MEEVYGFLPNKSKRAVVPKREYEEKMKKIDEGLLKEEYIADVLSICTGIHNAISSSARKEIEAFKRGKTISLRLNIELKANVEQYKTLLILPSKLKPVLNTLFIAGGTTYSINRETGSITAQQKVVAGSWIQMSLQYEGQ